MQISPVNLPSFGCKCCNIAENYAVDVLRIERPKAKQYIASLVKAREEKGVPHGNAISDVYDVLHITELEGYHRRTAEESYQNRLNTKA